MGKTHELSVVIVELGVWNKQGSLSISNFQLPLKSTRQPITFQKTLDISWSRQKKVLRNFKS